MSCTCATSWTLRRPSRLSHRRVRDGLRRQRDLIRSAVLQKLSIIGEAAARLSPELRDATTDVPWSAIIGLRNVAVHAYFSVHWPVIWTTATEDVPPLRVQMEAILQARFGGYLTADEPA